MSPWQPLKSEKNDMQMLDRQYIKKRKKLSRWIERGFVGLMNIGRKRHVPPPEQVRSVLVIRHNHLGDAVAASSFIEAIHDLWPKARVEVLASPVNAEAFSWVHGVDHVHVLPNGIGRRISFYLKQRHRHDLVFQTLVDEHYLKRALAARIMSGSACLVGRKRGSPLEELFDLSVFLPVGGYVGKLMSLLTPFCDASHLELLARHPQHRMTLPAKHVSTALGKLQAVGVVPRSYIALNISARVGFRELGTDQAAKLANVYVKRGIPVVLLHAPNERSRAAEIKAKVPGVTLLDCSSLGEAMAVAQNARLYLGPDTGTAHFAAAGRTPCVVLFSFQARADIWSPYGVPFVSIQSNPDLPVSELDHDLVVEYTDRMLAGEQLIRIVKSTPVGYSFGDVAVAPVRNGTV